MTLPSHSRRLAEFATSLRLSDVPADVVARAKSIVLDGLGCGLFGANLKWTEILSGVIRKLEPHGGVASIWGRRESASATSAALVNGTMVQGYELDDANPATMHSCAAVLPAVFAAVEYVGADKIDGERLLTAIIAGFEVGPRVGLCINGNQMLVNGWHTPGIIAPFPAALSAAIILGLDTDQTYHALGIAGAQSSGIMAAQFGSMVKRMLSAKGSQSGLYAALLAADGFTGIEDVFEAKYGGFCTTFTQSPDSFDLEQLTDGLGERWETMRIAIKRHACVGTNLSTLDALEDLVAETGLKAADVEHITVALTESAIAHSYWTPYIPGDLTAAQMHLGFCVAMKLIDGEVFVDQMVEANVGRPDLVEFAARLSVVRDLEREKRGRPFARGAVVEVALKDGRTLTKTVDYYLGSYLRPMTDEQMAAKYRRLAAKTLPEAYVTEIELAVRSIELTPTVDRLVELLRGEASAGRA
jgi:2-methylcitrate dehydratase PrpD